MTPEGKVKKKVSELLRRYSDLYVFMPVPSGYGQSTLDYIVCYRGRFIAIETKRPGGKPTDRQRQMMTLIERSGGAVFLIDGDIEELQHWLDSL